MSNPSDIQTRDELLRHPAIWRGRDLAHAVVPGIPTGFKALDAELPGGGWPPACLTEIMFQHEGIGELRILAPALADLSRQGKIIVWIAPPYLPNAPALAAAGMELKNLFIIKTSNAQESLWVAEESLRANACGAVLAWTDTRDFTVMRRLQVAVEGTSTISFVFRPISNRDKASPAPLRLVLEADQGGVGVQIIKRRGPPLHKRLVLPANLRTKLSEEPIDPDYV